MMNTKKNIRFPKKKYNSLPRIYKTWNNLEWEKHLSELKHSGFEECIGSQEKGYQVGLYLETHRR